MTFHSQTGPQTVNERSRQTRPAPIAQKSGAIHRARSQPAAVKRLQPLGGWRGACSAWTLWPFVWTCVTCSGPL